MKKFFLFLFLFVICLGVSSLLHFQKNPNLSDTVAYMGDFQQYHVAENLSVPKRDPQALTMIPYSLAEIQNMPAHTMLPEPLLDPALIPSLFYSTPITADIEKRILDSSYPKDAKILLEDLRYLRVLHYDADGCIHIGELIVNRKIEESVLEIFEELFYQKYPIEKMIQIDAYDGDDILSMEDNNTSGFNYRTIAGSTALSNHSYGMAIDINPKYNPYVYPLSKNKLYVSPESSKKYADRTLASPYKITADDLCVKLFKEHGFGWGGDWPVEKDYQHFEAYISRKG